MRVLAAVALLAVQAAAFTVAPRGYASTRLAVAEGDKLEVGEDKKINFKIDLESPKIATQEKLKAGEKKVYCRCWISGTFPQCDGSHAEHNKITGDNVGPIIVAAEKSE